MFGQAAAAHKPEGWAAFAQRHQGVVLQLGLEAHRLAVDLDPALAGEISYPVLILVEEDLGVLVGQLRVVQVHVAPRVAARGLSKS